jgi:tetratricopeptide (TPR) repeat protein
MSFFWPANSLFWNAVYGNWRLLMETNNAFPLLARNRVVYFLLVSLAVLFFAAVVYRVEHPSIVQREEARQMPGGGGMDAMGDMSGLSAMMKKLQDNPDDMETMRSLGMTFMEMKAWDKSISFWDMILERVDDDIMALNQKGFCLFEMEKYAEATEYFERMLRVEPQNPRAHFNLGIIFKYYLEEPEKAVPHFQAVVDSRPDDPQLLKNAERELAED